MFAHPSKKNILTGCYPEKPRLVGFCKLTGSIGFLSGDFVLSLLLTFCNTVATVLKCPSKRLTPPVAALGFRVALEKWLFFWLPFFAVRH